MRGPEADLVAEAEKIRGKSHLILYLEGVSWEESATYATIENSLKGRVESFRQKLESSYKKARDWYLEDREDLRNYWQEDKAKLDTGIKEDVKDSLIRIKDRSIASRNIRWVYASTAYFLTEHAKKQKNPDIQQRLKEVARKQILTAVDRSEKVDRVVLDRNWVYYEVLNPQQLLNPDHQQLRNNLVLFINHPPVLPH